MNKLSQNELQQISGAGVYVPTFPGLPGIAGGLATILAGVAFGASTILLNTGEGVAQILGVAHPRPA